MGGDAEHMARPRLMSLRPEIKASPGGHVAPHRRGPRKNSPLPLVGLLFFRYFRKWGSKSVYKSRPFSWKYGCFTIKRKQKNTHTIYIYITTYREFHQGSELVEVFFFEFPAIFYLSTHRHLPHHRRQMPNVKHLGVPHRRQGIFHGKVIQTRPSWKGYEAAGVP